MTAPQRVQLSRRKGWRKPENTVVVARPSKWGNPFRVVQEKCVMGGLCWQVKYLDERGNIRTWRDHLDSRENAVAVAVDAFRTQDVGPDPEEIRAELAGKNLACWCPLDQPCHADVLLEIANGPADGPR